MIPRELTCIILAGGESRRMGTNKPLTIYQGKPLIHWIFQALAPICPTRIIVANTGDFSFWPAQVVADNFPGMGPAAGIEAGLAACSTDLALVASCDTPNLPTGLFLHLLGQHEGNEITLASHEGVREPLIGVYSRSVHDRFRQALMEGDPHPHHIIRGCRWQEVPLTPDLPFYRPDLFLNLNTPTDLTV